MRSIKYASAIYAISANIFRIQIVGKFFYITTGKEILCHLIPVIGIVNNAIKLSKREIMIVKPSRRDVAII